VLSSDDCCDLDALANPDQTAFQGVANACGDFDYDCDEVIENTFQEATERFASIFRAGGSCSQVSAADCQPSFTVWASGVMPPCGTATGFSACNFGSFTPGGTPSCRSVAGNLATNNCR
jgi:hypothetical protein